MTSPSKIIMGNGASASQLISDDSMDYEKALVVVPILRQQVHDKDVQLRQCQEDLQTLKNSLITKESEITRLKAEVNKFKSVLVAKVHKDGKPDILSTIHEEALMTGQESRTKKQGVSGESAQTGHGVHEITRLEKDFK